MKYLVFLCLLFPSLCFSQSQSAPDAVFNLKLKSLKGESVSIKDYRGKYVLVRFWASWCTPCKRELPLLNAFYQAHKNKGIEVLGVSLDESEANAKDYLKHNPVSFPVVFDLKKQLPEAFSTESLASLYVFNKKGKLHDVISTRAQDQAFFDNLVSELVDQ